MNTGNPYDVLNDLRMAEEALRSQNCNFDANIMARAYESIWSLLNHADALATIVLGSSNDSLAAVHDYVSYRGGEASAHDKYIQDEPKDEGYLTET